MKKKLLSIVWLFAAIAFASCGGGNSTKSNGATGEETASGTAGKTGQKAPDRAKVPFEHGSYVQESEAMGIKMKTTVYFDNWGERLAGETKMDMMGMKIHQLKIEKENKRWELDLGKKTGTVTQSYSSVIVPRSGVDPESLANMSEKMRKEVTIDELGTEDYLGYKCKKVHIIYPQMEIDATTWTYGNLNMKMEGKMGKMDVNTKIISIDLSPPPASIFEVPEEVTITNN